MIESTSKTALPSARKTLFGTAFVRTAVLLGLLTAAALSESVHLRSLEDPDIWWHLRTGAWILQNHAVPHDGLFSQSASLSWVDSCWGFDVLVALAHRILGLRGLPILVMAFQVAATGAFFLLGRILAKNFWLAAVLTTVAQYGIAGLRLTPSLISMLLFAIVLALLFRSRRGAATTLFWLPLVFVLWVNLDRQFVYGLLAMGLFLLAIVVEDVCRRNECILFERDRPPMSVARVASIFGACLLATLFSPYIYHLHELVWQSANSVADHYFLDLHAMHFRKPQDYVLLLLVMAGFFALARRKSYDIFQFLLLIASSVISFRMQRDNWLVAMVSVAIIADALSQGGDEEAQDSVAVPIRRWEPWVVTGLVLAVLGVATLRIPAQDTALMAKVGASFPLRASDYIRENHLSQPLFNAYDWGGFLTWYLPEYPVVIDGRRDLYGDAGNIPYFRLMDAEIPLQSHRGFAQAQTFLLRADSTLGQALSTLPDFRVAYRDDQACVLVKRE